MNTMIAILTTIDLIGLIAMMYGIYAITKIK